MSSEALTKTAYVVGLILILGAFLPLVFPFRRAHAPAPNLLPSLFEPRRRVEDGW